MTTEHTGVAVSFVWLAISIILLLISRVVLARRTNVDFALSDDDAVVHLSIVDELRRNNFSAPDFSGRFLFSGTGYPWGFHLIFALSRIPLQILERRGTFVAVFFDGLTLFLVAISIYLFGSNSLYWLILFPLLRLFWGKSGRAHSFSERPFATFVGNLYLLAVFVFSEIESSLWLLAIAMIAGCVVMTSSKFALQAIVFFSLGFSVFFSKIEPVVILLFSLAFAALITKGEALKIVFSSVRWSVFYQQFLQARTSKTNRNFYSELLSGPTSSWLTLAKSNPIVGMALDNPMLLVALIAPVFGGSFSSWYLWLAIGVGLVLIISAPRLTFLGEPGRYLEFSVVPVFLVLANSPLQPGSVLSVMSILAGVSTLLIFVREIQKSRDPSSLERVADMGELRDWARGLKRGVLLANPGRLNLFLGYSSSNLRFLWIHSAISRGEKRSAFEKLVPESYPRATLEIGWFVEHFELQYLVLEKSHFSAEELKYREPHIAYTKCFENISFVAFSVERAP